MKGETYNTKADLYSLGMIFVSIFYNYKTEMEKIHIIEKIKKSDSDLDKIIKSLLDKNPDNRISINEVLKFFDI